MTGWMHVLLPSLLLGCGAHVPSAWAPSVPEKRCPQPHEFASFRLVEVPRGTVELAGERLVVPGFCMATTEVSIGDFVRLVGTNPARTEFGGVPFTDDQFPIQNVRRGDALSYLEELDARVGDATFGLPTGAEWARAAHFTWDSVGRRALTRSENVRDSLFCPGESPRVVNVQTSFLPQELPRQMFGNVAEWVADTPSPGIGVVFGLDYSSPCRLLTVGATSTAAAIPDDWLNSFIGFRVAAKLPPG